MAEYIERNAVLELEDVFEDEDYYFLFISPEEVKSIPAADVAPVRHGHWVMGRDEMLHCSCCEKAPTTKIIAYGNVIFNVAREHLEYCPRCGAIMDGGNNG